MQEDAPDDVLEDGVAGVEGAREIRFHHAHQHPILHVLHARDRRHDAHAVALGVGHEHELHVAVGELPASRRTFQLVHLLLQ